VSQFVKGLDNFLLIEGLDAFWSARLPASRKGTRWLQVLQTLVAYRLIDPGSEWRLHRHWFTSSAMADLLEADFGLAGKDTLYRCLDKLPPHKDALMLFLKQRWGELFGASFDVLLYDLTSTYFEADTPREAPDKRQYGYSRDKRGDCRQVVIGLIVTPEGFPLSYEVLAGNTADCTTLSDLLKRIETRYGKANRIWVMDRGIPTEETLAQMREMGASYLVGTPKGRLSKLERAFLSASWEACAGRGTSQASAPGERNLCACPQRAADRQRTWHAAAPAQALCGKAQAVPRTKPHTRPATDESGGGQTRRRASREPDPTDTATKP